MIIIPELAQPVFWTIFEYFAVFIFGMAAGVGICLWFESSDEEVPEDVLIKEYYSEALERLERENAHA